MTLRNMNSGSLPGLQKKSKPTGKLTLKEDQIKKELTTEEIKKLCGREKYPIVFDVSAPYIQITSTDCLASIPPNTLKEVDLTANGITDLSCFANQSKLKRLTADKNCITTVSFQGLSSLVHVSLAFNAIQYIPDLSPLVNCQFLNLRANRLCGGFENLKHAKNLRLLDLAKNDLEMTMFQFYNQIVLPLKELPKLQFLCFKANPLEIKIMNFKYFLIAELPKLEYYNYAKITKEEKSKAFELQSTNAFAAKDNDSVRPPQSGRQIKLANNSEQKDDILDQILGTSFRLEGEEGDDLSLLCRTDSNKEIEDLLEDLGFNEESDDDADADVFEVDKSLEDISVDGDPLDDILDYLNEPMEPLGGRKTFNPSSQSLSMGVASTQSVANRAVAMEDDDVDYFKLLGDMISTNDSNEVSTPLFQSSNSDIFSMLDELTGGNSDPALNTPVTTTTTTTTTTSTFTTAPPPRASPSPVIGMTESFVDETDALLRSLTGSGNQIMMSNIDGDDEEDSYAALINELALEDAGISSPPPAATTTTTSNASNNYGNLSSPHHQENLQKASPATPQLHHDDSFDILDSLLMEEKGFLSMPAPTPPPAAVITTNNNHNNNNNNNMYAPPASSNVTAPSSALQSEEDELMDMLAGLIEESNTPIISPRVPATPTNTTVTTTSTVSTTTISANNNNNYNNNNNNNNQFVDPLDELTNGLDNTDWERDFAPSPLNGPTPTTTVRQATSISDDVDDELENILLLASMESTTPSTPTPTYNINNNSSSNNRPPVAASLVANNLSVRSREALLESEERIKRMEMEEQRINAERQARQQALRDSPRVDHSAQLERIRKESELQAKLEAEAQLKAQLEHEELLRQEAELRQREIEAEERLAAARLRQLKEEEEQIEAELAARQLQAEERRLAEQEEMRRIEAERVRLAEEKKARETLERLRQEEEKRREQEYQQQQLEKQKEERLLREKIEQKKLALLKQQQEEEERKRKESDELLRLLEEEQAREEKARLEKERAERRAMEEKGLVDQLINQLDVDDIGGSESDPLMSGGFDSNEFVQLRHVAFPYTINSDNVQIFEQLGGGTFGSCYRAIYDRKEVVVKKLNCNLLQDEVFIQEFKQQVSALALLDTRKFPMLFETRGAWFTLDFAFVTEYVIGTPLFGMLRNRGIVLDVRDKLHFVQQIAMGVQALHEQNIIYQGLKSKNVIITPDQQVKLRDFGLPCIKDFVRQQGSVGTPQYYAPEVIQNIAGATSDPKSDVYSFGILLWEIFAEQTPYQGMMAREISIAVVHDQLRPAEPENCPVVVWKVMNSCWAHDPAQRPTFEMLIRILSQPLENIMKYGLTQGSTVPLPRGCVVAPTVNPNPNSDDSRIHAVVKQVQDMLLSGQPAAQIKALKVLINIGRTETNIQPLVDSGVISQLHQLLPVAVNNDPAIPENAAHALAVLCEWPACEEKARIDGVIVDAVQNLESTTHGDMVIIQSAKLLISMTREPQSQQAAAACGIGRVLMIMLQSPNDHFKMQAVWLVSQLLEDETFQHDFHQVGGIKQLMMMLSSTNPGIQFRVLVALGNLLTNQTFYPIVQRAGVLPKLLELLKSNNKLLKLQAVKATERFSKKGGLRTEISKSGGMPCLVQLLQADNDAELIMVALNCLINFATDKQQILNFKRAEGLPAVLTLLAHQNNAVQFQALKFFELFVAPAELNKEIARATGFVPKCVGLLTSSHVNIQKTAVDVLLDMAKGSSKSIEAIIASGGIPPLLHIVEKSSDEIIKRQAVQLLSTLLTLDESGVVRQSLVTANSIPKLITMLRSPELPSKEAAALLISVLSSDQTILHSLQALNALPSLISILRATADSTLQEKLTTVLSAFIADDAFHGLFSQMGGFEAIAPIVNSENSIAQTAAIKCMLMLCRNPANKQLLLSVGAHQHLATLARSGTPSLKMAAMKCLTFLK